MKTTTVKLNDTQIDALNKLDAIAVANLAADVMTILVPGITVLEAAKIIAEAKQAVNPDLPKPTPTSGVQRVQLVNSVSDMKFDELLKQDAETRNSMEWKGAMRKTTRGQRVIALNADGSIHVETSIDAFTQGLNRETWNGKRMVTLDEFLNEEPRYLPWGQNKIDPSSVWATLTEDQMAIIYWADTMPEDRGGIPNLQAMEKMVARDLKKGDWSFFDETIAAIERAKSSKTGRLEYATCVASQYEPSFKGGGQSADKNSEESGSLSAVIDGVNIQALKQDMELCFDDSDLQDLAFSFSIDYENLSGNTKTKKIISFIKYFDSRDEVMILARRCRNLRKNRTFGISNGAVAQGNGSVAVGQGGVYVGGSVINGNIHVGGDFVGGDKINTVVNHYRW